MVQHLNKPFTHYFHLYKTISIFGLCIDNQCNNIEHCFLNLFIFVKTCEKLGESESDDGQDAHVCVCVPLVRASHQE